MLRWIDSLGVSNHDVAELAELRKRTDGFLWLDIPEWSEEAEAILTNDFHFHSMAIAESKTRSHVPRVHVYPDHVFIVVHAPEIGAAATCGLPDGPAGWHRRHHHRAVRPGHEDQPVRHVLALQEGASPHVARPAIINTSSVQAVDRRRSCSTTPPPRPASSTSPRDWPQELADKGIRVNAVAPGPIWTPLIPATMPPNAASPARHTAAGPRRPTRRGRSGLRLPRLAGVDLHHRRDDRRHRRQAGHLGGTAGLRRSARDCPRNPSCSTTPPVWKASHKTNAQRSRCSASVMIASTASTA